MELRTAVSPRDVKHYTTERLREEFLIQNLFVPGEIKLVYSHIDRIITGAAVPTQPITLTAGDELRAGPSIRDAVPEHIPLSGVWWVRIRISMIWTALP